MTQSNRCGEVTKILLDEHSDPAAMAAALFPLVYEDLKERARAALKSERQAQDVEATALVHDAYLKLAAGDEVPWQNRRHFFAAASLAMRRILIDQARHRQRLKRGGDVKQITFNSWILDDNNRDQDLIELHEVIEILEQKDPRKGQIVNLKFFAGQSNEAVASILDVSLSTLEREWRFIKAWLQSELGQTKKNR